MKLLKYIIRFLYCKMHNINKAEYTLLIGGGKLGENCEIYSRVVGFLTPTHRWNNGKQAEFAMRKHYEKAVK